METIIITFILKLFDNGLATIKSILLHKGKYLASSIFNSLGTFFYLVAINNMVKDNSINTILAMCVATFLGSYIPAKFLEKIDKKDLE